VTLGLYLHVPFCSSICNYCNFNRGLFDESVKRRYVEALGGSLEITARFPDGSVSITNFGELGSEPKQPGGAA